MKYRMHGAGRALLDLVRRGAVAGLVSILAACGGGGGGGSGGASTDPAGGSNGSGPFSITLDKQTLSFTYTEGAFPGSAMVTATAHGKVPDTVYVGAVVEGQGISPNIPAYFTDTGAQFTVNATGLSAGTYTGRILFYACSDSACTRPIGGTPLAVSYTVKVLAPLRVPSSVRLTAVSGSAASGDLAVQLPTGVSNFSARVTSGGDWLSLGTAHDGVQPLVASSQRSGAYFGAVEIQAGGQTAWVNVVYEVSAPAGGEHDLSASPTSLTFATYENSAPAAQLVSALPPTWATTPNGLQYRVEYTDASPPWLTLQATGSGVNVLASAQQLGQGHYAARVRVTHADTQHEIVVPVALTVGPNLVKPADRSIKVTSDTQAPALSGTAQVNLVEGTPVAWTASSSAPWLKLTRASGDTGSEVRYTVDTALLAALDNYSDQTATVTVTPVPGHVTPVSFNVSLRKEIGEIHYAGPYLLMSGTPQMVRLRGRGFNGITPSTYLDTGGSNPSSITRLNDTQLQLQLPALSAGSYTLSLSNALGLPPTQVTLRVVQPQTYSYAAYPTGGAAVYWMLYDPWRQAAFLASRSEAVVRYQFSAGGWTNSQASFPGLTDLGMGPDGDSLIGVSSQGRLRLISADTLQTQFQVDHGQPSGITFTYVRFGIPTTNDGRSWFPVGGGWNQLVHFDHRTRTIVTPPWDTSSMYYSGPWMAVSRNGERMLLVQTASLSPSPPMLYMDATDGVLRNNGIGMTFSYDLSLSDDGRRAVFDSWQVRDEEFGLIGQINLPDSLYYARKSIISPDGRRVYVVAYSYESTYAQTPSTGPRVYVFDSSVRPATGTALPLIQQFDLADYPSCHISTYDCDNSPRMVISPDGRTLFLAGSKNFLVVPIPQASGTPGSSGSGARAQAQSVRRPAAQPFQLWVPSRLAPGSQRPS